MRKYVLFFILLLISANSFAQFKLPYLIGNEMVLQRNVKVPIWGWGDHDAQVSVSFNGQIQKTTVNSNGQWLVKLSPMPTSFIGQEMVITVGKEQRTLSNVLIGEVWLCSGQSNMEFKLASLVNTDLSKEVMPIIEQLTIDIEQSKDPLLRQVQASKSLSPFKPLYNGTGKWISVDPKVNSQFSATAFYFGRELRKSLNVPIGLVVNAYGGSPIEGWLPMDYWGKSPALTEYYDKSINRAKAGMAKWDKEKVAQQNKVITQQWRKDVIEAKKNNKTHSKRPKLIIRPDLHRGLPSTEYNAMLTPVLPYAIKGVIWYQGEANANSGSFTEAYVDMMTDLVNIWRKKWGNPTMPFYYVQLANYKAKRPSNTEEIRVSDNWAKIRNQQRLSLSIPNTGMAVITDIGQADNIHPKNKQDVGKRLALWALANTYNQNIQEHSGPLVQSAIKKDQRIIISFGHTATGLMAGEKKLLQPTSQSREILNSFEIQDQNGDWHSTKAEVFKKHQIVIFNKKYKQAKAIRYAWSMNPISANLYNKAGLPASPFKISIE